MWVIDNYKEQVRNVVRNDLKSNITNLMHVSNKVHELIVSTINAIGDSPSGADKEIENNYRSVLCNLSEILTSLYEIQSLTEMLDTRKWVDG